MIWTSPENFKPAELEIKKQNEAANMEADAAASRKPLEAVAPCGAKEPINLDDVNSLMVSMSCAVRVFKAFGNDSHGLDHEEYIGLLDALADTVLLYATKIRRAIYGEDEIYI